MSGYHITAPSPEILVEVAWYLGNWGIPIVRQTTTGIVVRALPVSPEQDRGQLRGLGCTVEEMPDAR